MFPEYDWSDKTVLIAEDEEVNLLYFTEILEGTNITILTAGNGQEAVDMVKDTNNNIDLILMDIKMPIMDGFEATQEILKMNPNIPVIAQTAHVLESERNQCFTSGCKAYIAKPIDIVELLKTMNDLLQ